MITQGRVTCRESYTHARTHATRKQGKHRMHALCAPTCLSTPVSPHDQYARHSTGTSLTRYVTCTARPSRWKNSTTAPRTAPGCLVPSWHTSQCSFSLIFVISAASMKSWPARHCPTTQASARLCAARHASHSRAWLWPRPHLGTSRTRTRTHHPSPVTHTAAPAAHPPSCRRCALWASTGLGPPPRRSSRAAHPHTRNQQGRV